MICIAYNIRVAVYLGVAFAATFMWGHLAHAQDSGPPADAASDLVLQSWKKQDAVALCVECHYNPPDNPLLRDEATNFSRRTELKFWLDRDKHAIARRRVEPLSKAELLQQAEAISENLQSNVPPDWFGQSNVLSRRICDKLEYEVTTTEGYKKFQQNCMTCHGGFRDNPNEKVGFDRPLADPISSQPGISCNYCHQDGDSIAWIKEHGVQDAAKAWRTKLPEEKLALGMRDLVNTSKQADLCLDCHVGNRANNQFVTHEMYAAGHPPLPSVEVQTFCEQMPQHWQSLSQLHDALATSPTRDPYFAANFPELFPNAQNVDAGKMYWNTRKMLLGAIAARIKTVNLLTESATEDRWGDYALYDCAACHHELQTPSARQQRGFPGAPGRPRQTEWPESLLNTALLFSRAFEAPRAFEKELQLEFSRQPFGDAVKVSGIARQLSESLDAARRAAQRKPIDAAMAKNVLLALARTNESQLLTYDSARQVAWGMQLVADEMKQEGSPLSPQIQTLIDSLSNGASGTGIETILPAGRQVFIYPKNLEEDLQRRANYDRTVFVQRLRQLNGIIARSAVVPTQVLTTK